MSQDRWTAVVRPIVNTDGDVDAHLRIDDVTPTDVCWGEVGRALFKAAMWASHPARYHQVLPTKAAVLEHQRRAQVAKDTPATSLWVQPASPGTVLKLSDQAAEGVGEILRSLGWINAGPLKGQVPEPCDYYLDPDAFLKAYCAPPPEDKLEEPSGDSTVN